MMKVRVTRVMEQVRKKVIEEGADDEDLDEMAAAGLIHDLITGKPTASCSGIRNNLSCIFIKIFRGMSMVNAGFKELAKYIDETTLGHLGTILSDIYMSASVADEEDSDSDDVDFQVEEEREEADADVEASQSKSKTKTKTKPQTPKQKAFPEAEIHPKMESHQIKIYSPKDTLGKLLQVQDPITQNITQKKTSTPSPIQVKKIKVEAQRSKCNDHP